MPARAGSPTSDATVANIALLAIAKLQHKAAVPYTCPRSDASVITVTWLGALKHNARMTATQTSGGTFYGWRVVGAAFVLAVFGWGMGFYGPPVFLSVVHETTGWPLALISTAVTTHFLIGAAAGANLPSLYRRFGAAATTKAAALSLAVGTLGWAIADTRWQLFAAALLSGAGWGAMSAVAINAIVSRWFVRGRPAALAMAYNGGSIGGVVFSPLWVAAIDRLGFPVATMVIPSLSLMPVTSSRRIVISGSRSIAAVTRRAKSKRSTARAWPAGTAVAVAISSRSEPARRISSFSSHGAVFRLVDFKEFEHTSSAKSAVWCAGVERTGRISHNSTSTPRRAHCHAASEPANPAPMILMGRIFLTYFLERFGLPDS